MISAAHSATDIARDRTRARLVLLLFLLTAGFFVAITLSPLRSGFADAPDRGPGDVELYEAEAKRVHAGQSYYDAAAAELTQRGYPTRSIFNWRTPLPVWLVGKLPQLAAANVILGLAGLALALLSFRLLVEEGTVNQAITVVLLLAGAVLPCLLGPLVLVSELWSGVLLAMSAVLFGIKRPCAGVAAGIGALVFRELAAPYCLLCVALAAYERRYRELALWGIGLAAYAVYFGLHVAQVLPRIGPEAIAHQAGWIRLGGAGFVISTAQMNAYLLLLPQWVTAIYLACALLGAATWNTPAGRLIAFAVAGYLVAFGIAGHDFNQYWGSEIAPLVCLPAARSPAVLRQLWREATAVPTGGAQPRALIKSV
ncbi:MAG: hypothetical protein WD063_03410 [Pirellulales bacterium]